MSGHTSVLKFVLLPINRAGWPFIGIFAAVTALLFIFTWQPLGWAGVVLTLWCTFFFRDPDRVTPLRPGLVISPADGLVQMITRAAPPAELGLGEEERTRVSVFMSVFDVHVNRMPVAGTVRKIAYRPGKFLNATLDKASVDNERNSIHVETADGRPLTVVQIAGLVARRIKCDVAEGDSLRTGERIGLIRFGSRLDVYLPDGVAPLVCVGQKAVAGETVLADLTADEPARDGEVR